VRAQYAPAGQDGGPYPAPDAVCELVIRARDGDEQAWYMLVDRYAPLVKSICRRYRLGSADTDDVGQAVWFRLVQQLASLREPRALPGWLATTTRNECLRVLRAARRYDRLGQGTDADAAQSTASAPIEDEIVAAELNAALRAAFAELPAPCQMLLSMLISDPPFSYAHISAAMSVPQGSIGPQRARCLARLRRSPQLKALSDSGLDAHAAAGANSERPGR
jgi:RNA polymerase sigma factor (sigma-70 family)